ncbi:MAG: bifunctional biotin--[acetyl-CoA-carboxylase] ligase/biotin operon repressor BirA, partial [Gammaproteobacteria bacterium]|nr:bifunctional biotin--[acetyl-CoA-carboxylase] ligase/biotin operon repressor BirA [Gammaproteobacteria bacterium]
APMIVWEFPCESRTLPGFNTKKPLLLAGVFFRLHYSCFNLSSVPHAVGHAEAVTCDMTDTLHSLIAMLADGRFHSGEALGARLGIGRSAVWKSLQQLPALGLEVHAVSGRGYRLAEPIELLDAGSISSRLIAPCSRLLTGMQILPAVDSTNNFLKQAAENGAPSGMVCLAESQQAGRGRRGRHWHSPYGSNIYLSILWRFHEGMSRLGGLSLAVAVAIMRGLDALGVRDIGIKWPNDIVSKEGKIAGILLEIAGESGGPCHAVIGAGVNYAMSPAAGSVINQPWTSLLATGTVVGRNELAAMLLNRILEVLAIYEMRGFEPFRAEWQRWDMLRDQAVTLHLANQSCHGVARGIDETGMLLVEHEGKVQRYASADVSLRKAI